MRKHTPGPWFAEDRLTPGSTIRVMHTDDEGDRVTIANVRDGNISNAALVAAAPELLDAAENLVIAIGMGWDLDGVTDAVKAAIAKATQGDN